MNEQYLNKRLFLGFEVIAPWQNKYPSGRLLKEQDRHLTIVFLGQQNADQVLDTLPQLPQPPFPIGPVGNLKNLLFLPPKHPHVAAFELELQEGQKKLENFQKEISTALQSRGFSFKDHPRFLPHVTIARSPFDSNQWKKIHPSLPCYLKNLNLYESLAQLNYPVLWSQPLQDPFEEIVHTADIAFLIYGKDLAQIRLHACWALFFKVPSLQKYWQEAAACESLEDLIIELNHLITLGDTQEGIPLKAVSFHGEIAKKNDLYVWEMIIDV